MSSSPLAASCIIVSVTLAISACEQSATEPKDGVSILPNGMKLDRSTAPSGKRIVKTFATDNSLLEESHFYPGPNGKTGILVTIRFDHGRKTGEVYVQNGRLVSREVYERERVKYAEMPAADTLVVDSGLEGQRKVNDEIRRQPEKAKRRLSMSPVEKLDSQCEDAMTESEHQDLAEWRRTGRPIVLGELDEKTSAAIVNDLFGAGAVRVVATGVMKDPKRGLDANWIVSEIPKDPATRHKLFAIFERLAGKDGWDPTPDLGQRYQLLGKFK